MLIFFVVVIVSAVCVGGFLYFRNSKSARSAAAPIVTKVETDLRNKV